MTVTTDNSARAAATDALIHAAPQGMPTRPTPVNTAGLDPRDARLAEAIYRTTVQQWLTVNHLLDACLTRQAIEPHLRAVLAGGAAQLLFMDRLPAHAVVDTTVELAKHRVRQGAGKLVNAVLRKVAEMVVERQPDQPWAPADNRIPWHAGYLQLSRQAMLKPRQTTKYLSVATSHHPRLVDAWVRRFGEGHAIELLTHDLKNPPTLVHAPAAAVDADQAERHRVSPFVVWRGDHSALRAFLEASTDRWVQDLSAYAVIEATAAVQPATILDACAGRGTKTLGLALRHPGARVLATDVHTDRLGALREAADRFENIDVVAPDELKQREVRADLVLLDVPCTNTGVLARRPEAKYRFSRRAVDSVIATQRAILADAIDRLAPGGTLVYSTCSLEPVENDEQAAWAAERFGMTIVNAVQHLPTGAGPTYRDGAYYAMLKRA